MALVGLQAWGSKIPWFDPAPRGEGSYKELASITKQFKDYYRTHDASLLPEGYVRLEGIGEEGSDGASGTWMIYYATASHSKVRGGTIVLMDGTGRIDTYFGHHCSRRDGGKVQLSARVSGEMWDPYFESAVRVREGFGATFKHQGTEHITAANPGVMKEGR